MTPKDEKAALRRASLLLRDAMPVARRIDASLAIASHSEAIPGVTAGVLISGFSPIRSEVDIRPLMQRLAARGARLCLPVVIDRTTIVFRECLDGAPLVKTGFGTTGPPADAPVVDPGLLLVPLAAFDGVGHRIGYGAGHYDRAIEGLYRKGLTPRLIGIAFDCQEVATVPAEPHDAALDAVLTESGLRFFKPEMDGA